MEVFIVGRAAHTPLRSKLRPSISCRFAIFALDLGASQSLRGMCATRPPEHLHHESTEIPT